MKTFVLCCAGPLSRVWLLVTPRSPPGSSVQGDSPGKNTEVGCHTLLQGIFPTQGSNPGLLHCRQILYHLSHQGKPISTEVGNLAYPFSRGSSQPRNWTKVSCIAGAFFTSWATREARRFILETLLPLFFNRFRLSLPGCAIQPRHSVGTGRGEIVWVRKTWILGFELACGSKYLSSIMYNHGMVLTSLSSIFREGRFLRERERLLDWL